MPKGFFVKEMQMRAYKIEVASAPERDHLRVRVWAGDDEAGRPDNHTLAFTLPHSLAAKLAVALKEGIESKEFVREIR